MNYWSVIGLVADIFGVLILFRYGLPSRMNTVDRLASEKDLTDKQKKENKHIHLMAFIGLFLLLIGFAFQLLGVIFPPSC